MSKFVRFLSVLAAMAITLMGCSSHESQEQELRARTQALTLEQNRILGFEDGPVDWSNASGATLTRSSTVSAGTGSLSVVLNQNNGYTQLTSSEMRAPGNAMPTATFDIQVPSGLPWGEARLVARIPSQNHYWADLGGANLLPLESGRFHTLSFNVPQHIQTALNSTASDVSFIVVINSDRGVGPFLVDNLVVSSGSSAPPSTGGSTDQVAFSISVPRGTAVEDVMMSASQKLTIDDRSTLGSTGTLTTVASIGPDRTEFGAGVTGFTNVISEGDVDFLRSQSTIYGHITTEGEVLIQDGSVNTPGGVSQGSQVTGVETSWTVDWPVALHDAITLAPDAPDTALAPGGYSSLVAYSRSTLTLRSGTYYFDSLVLEPQVNFRVEAASGPVIIYVRDTIRLNVGLEYLSGEEGQVLFGFLGNEAPLFREGMAASIVAPNATIELRRPNSGTAFRGSYFGKAVHVFSDATVEHIPLDWAFVCPLGDFDRDGVFDCSDQCRFSAIKAAPGICGCQEADTDSDGDGIPDCKDACGADADDFYAGTCGCPSDPAPAGTPCFDDICFNANNTCDGNGQCGDLSCRPHADCRPLYSKSNDKFYWVCSHQVSWDEAKVLCANQEGSKLASISEAEINQLVASNGTTSMWIGANALDQAGEWRWLDYTTDSGQKFWTGGETGRPIFSRFNAFNGAPAAEAECAAVETNGRWTDSSCTESHGFVCEVSNDRIGLPPPRTRRPGEIVGIPPYQPPGDDCVDPADWFGDEDSEAEVLGLFEACQSCLEINGEGQCDDVCVGPAAVPDENSECTFSDADYLVSDAACGEGSLEVALDGNGDEISCSESEDCVGEPPAEAVKCERTSECTGDNQRCIGGHCITVLMCDTQAGRCVVPNNSCGSGEQDLPERCDEVEFCEPTPSQVTTTIEAPSADLQPVPSDPEDFFGEEPEVPDEIEPYDAEACTGCGSLPPEDHPWCRVDLEANQALPGQGNETEQNGENDGDKIKFEFIPTFEFTQDASLGALGIPTVNLRAAAGLYAGVKVNFAGNPRFDIINALGELDASQCGFHGDVTLEIFGGDVIESYKEQNGLPLDLPENTCAEDDEDCLSPQQQCEKAYTQFAGAVDRAEKAMRDASELMRQYKEAVRNGSRLPDDFCRDVIPDAARPRGFPSGICPPNGETESPEATIQRFIDYYVMTITGFGSARYTEGAMSLNDYAQNLIGYLNQLPNAEGEIELADFSPEPEDETIIAAQFFIGPIPAFLEVGTTIDFGITVNARAGLRVGDLVEQILDFSSAEANSTEVAYAGVSGAPYAGAGLYMFAGVGFGIPGFKVQIGVQGDVSIGTISLPAYAGAGLWMGSQADDREAPTTLGDFSTGDYLIPRKIYSAQLGYTAGLEARVRDILAGSVSGKLKLQVLFFSKTWKATIVRFDGICSHNDEAADGSLENCDFPLLSASGQAVAAEGEFGWGFMKMPTSFPGLRLPSRDELRAQIADELGQTEIPEEPPLADLPIQGFSEARVAATLYDSFCKECLERDEVPEYEEDDCFSNSDCCEETDVCFDVIRSDDEDVGRSVCRACGVAQGVSSSGGGECYQDSHCCDNINATTGDSYGGICWGGKCRTGQCTQCSSSSDCAPGYGCGFPETNSGFPVCLSRNEDNSLNRASCIIVR